MRHKVLLLVVSSACFSVHASAQKVPDLRIDTSGSPSAAHAQWSRITASGDAVYAVWQDDRNGQPNDDIFFNRSLDGGRTWLASDVRIDAGTSPGTVAANHPELGASGSTVHVVWSDRRNDPQGTGYDIFYNRSTDGGTTWLPAEVRLDTGVAPGSNESNDPAIAVEGTDVYVVWTDDRNHAGFYDVYFNRSLDAGTTWLPAATMVDTDPLGGAASTQVAVSGGRVYVVWRDNRMSWGWDVHFNRSLDKGATWLVSDARLNASVAAGTTVAADPFLAAVGSKVFVTWDESRVGSRDIYCNRSLDGGATWLPTEVRLDASDAPGSNASERPAIAASANGVFVAWEENRNGNTDVYFNRSLDDGATWLPAEIRLDVGTAPGTEYATKPRVAATASDVFVVWEDDRNSPFNFKYDVYLNRSSDAGTTWLASEVRLDTGDTPGSNRSGNPQVALTRKGLHVLWEDQRGGANPDDDVYYNLAFGFQPYGTGKAGSGGFVPDLDTTGLALAGGSTSIDVGQGLGGTAGVLLLGLSGPAAIPVAGGTLLVQLPVFQYPLALGGAPGVPGAGTTSFPLGLPANPNLIGVRANFQALLLDPGASSSASMSDAEEMWIG